MNVALVYDRVNKWGGAERVLLALHDLFPDAPLYTSVYHKEKAHWAKTFDVKPSFLQDFPFAKEAHELYPLLMPTAFESFTFDEYDVVISVTSEAAKGIITKPSTLHICYCLTPTRYLWSGYDEYFQGSISKVLAWPAIKYLRMWDKVASSRPDLYISISTEIQERIARFYQRESEIIHPPVALFEERAIERKKSDKDYFLVVSRLVAYKRIDIAIDACNKLQLPLKIVGTGSQEAYLKKLAGPTIEFLGNVNDEQLVSLYQGSKALLFPGFEDFGIVMGEALGFGIPVIAYKRGGARDIVSDRKTGILFSSQSSSSLMKAIHEFEKLSFNPQALRKQAEKFSKAQFKEKLGDYIDQALQNKKITL